eukprot:scaffold1455_cov65-Phaeocystis_antarctica.AAC.2
MPCACGACAVHTKCMCRAYGVHGYVCVPCMGTCGVCRATWWTRPRTSPAAAACAMVMPVHAAPLSASVAALRRAAS